MSARKQKTCSGNDAAGVEEIGHVSSQNDAFDGTAACVPRRAMIDARPYGRKMSVVEREDVHAVRAYMAERKTSIHDAGYTPNVPRAPRGRNDRVPCGRAREACVATRCYVDVRYTPVKMIGVIR